MMIFSTWGENNSGYELRERFLCVTSVPEAHLLLHTVPGVHVFDVIEEVADGVHEAKVLTVLIHRLEHLVEGHTDLKHQTSTCLAQS